MSTTELDDLKTAWQSVNRNLERHHTLALQQFKESKLSRFRSALRPLATGQMIQLICGAILAGLSAQFWMTHLSTYHLMMYGILLHGYGIMLAGFAVRDLILMRGIDYGTPVVALRKQVEALRLSRLRAGMWFGIAGCFIWLPLMLMIFCWLGLDVWSAKPQVVAWLVLNSVVCVGLAAAVMHSFRNGQNKLARHLRDSSVGRSVNRAAAALDEIARFEQE